MGIFANRRIRVRSGGLSGLAIIGVVSIIRLLGLLQTLEWNALDLALRKRPAEAVDEFVTIVTITEEDIQKSLSYPIADESLAELLNTLQTHEPRVIGLDIFRDFPVGDGYESLARIFANSDNIIGIKKITEPVVPGPKGLAAERVGFADAPLDKDGALRRSLLGVYDHEGEYQFSLTIRLVEQYLAQAGLSLDNGRRDFSTMRFGNAEIPRFRAYTGGYARADDAGNQTLIHFRAGPNPFETLTYGELMSGDIDPALIHDRIVLIGYNAVSAKDFVNVAALPNVNPGEALGVEVQAHAASQIINAALNNRSFLQTFPASVEYALIISAGLLGLGLARIRLYSYLHFFTIVGVSSFLIILFYASILVGLWLPIIPALIAFTINALALYPLYQLQAQLGAQLKQREYLIDWTFSTIHNGPLQTLARFLKEWPTDSQYPNFNKTDLNQLNQELRDLYDAMRQEMLAPTQQLVLSQKQVVNLDIPLAELLYEIYSNTTKRRKDFFEKLLHITEFKEIDDSDLTPEQKRDLGRFLEESLLNVCKYASGTTRLHVICQPEGTNNVIRVIDNSSNGLSPAKPEGYGSRQARQLAKSLRGSFERHPVEPKGVRCELRWPIATQQRRGWRWFDTLKLQTMVPKVTPTIENSKLEQ